MDMLVEVEFGRSTSSQYHRALDVLQRFGNVELISTGNSVNRATLGPDGFKLHYTDLEELWGIIKNWKSSKLTYNGQPAFIHSLREFFRILECCKRRAASERGDKHCMLDDVTPGWGCRFLRSVFPGIPEHRYSLPGNGRPWFEFGSFSAPTVWAVDKDRIQRVLFGEANSKGLELCEYYSQESIQRQVQELPDEIDTALDNSRWAVKYERSVDGSVLKERPIAIEPKTWESAASRSGVDWKFSLFGDDPAQSEERVRFIPETRFSDLGGIDSIVDKVREVIEVPLKHPELFEKLGIKPHRGILLHGVPGCGKTLIAKAIANEIQAHFIPIRGPELYSKWVGQSESNLRSVFEEAREFQPSVIFFDEIDSVAQIRSSEESVRFQATFVNQLLTLMDGIDTYGDICVIASTNRPELLDPALLRPGRFDYSLEVEKPTLQGCLSIFRIHTRKMPMQSTFDIERFAQKLLGLTGAEIAFVAREGAYNCLRRSLDFTGLLTRDSLDNNALESLLVVEKDFQSALRSLDQD